ALLVEGPGQPRQRSVLLSETGVRASDVHAILLQAPEPNFIGPLERFDRRAILLQLEATASEPHPVVAVFGIRRGQFLIKRRSRSEVLRRKTLRRVFPALLVRHDFRRRDTGSDRRVVRGRASDDNGKHQSTEQTRDVRFHGRPSEWRSSTKFSLPKMSAAVR